MANYTERIEAAKEKIEQYEKRMKELIQKQKMQERKARTKRLIECGAIVESIVPEVIVLSDEQFKIFLEKTIKTEFARKILSGMNPQNNEPDAPNLTEAAQDNATVTAQTVGGRSGESGIKSLSLVARAHICTT